MFRHELSSEISTDSSNQFDGNNEKYLDLHRGEVISQRAFNSMQKETKVLKQLPPLYLCLASVLNVELVYIILKGITQFGFLN